MAADDNKAKLRQQLEYYFSDSNFRRDKFLRQKVAEDPDGFVQLSVLLTFNRVKSLTEGTDAKVEALAAAVENSEELELSGDRAAVRRVKPLPSEDDSDARTLYVKGRFHPDATLDQLLAFFAPYGKVNRVQMRRFTARRPVAGEGVAAGTMESISGFKGSVFVEFATVEDAAAFLEKAKAGAVVNTLPAPPKAAKPADAAAAAAAASTSSSAGDAAAAAPADSSAAAGGAGAGEAAAAAAPAAAAGPAPVEIAELRASYWARKKVEVEERRAGKGGADAKIARIAESAGESRVTRAGGDCNARGPWCCGCERLPLLLLPLTVPLCGSSFYARQSVPPSCLPHTVSHPSAWSHPFILPRPAPPRPALPFTLCPAGRKFERTMTPGLILKLSGIGAAATQDTIGLFLNSVGVPKAPAAAAAAAAGEGSSADAAGGAGAGAAAEEADEGGHLRFVDFEEGTGATVAHCRFASPAAATAAAAAVNAGGEEARKATGADKPAAEVLA